MTWIVEFNDVFFTEFVEFSEEVKRELVLRVEYLKDFGHSLGRPYVDTLSGSKHSNMKELRFDADNGVWRVVFAFDPERKAILLVAGDKSGTSQTRFYKQLIKKADKRFDDHLSNMKKGV